MVTKWHAALPPPTQGSTSHGLMEVVRAAGCGGAPWARHAAISSSPRCALCALQLKVRQDEEKKQLCALRDQLKAALQLEQREVRDSSSQRAGGPILHEATSVPVAVTAGCCHPSACRTWGASRPGTTCISCRGTSSTAQRRQGLSSRKAMGELGFSMSLSAVLWSLRARAGSPSLTSSPGLVARAEEQVEVCVALWQLPMASHAELPG